MPVKVNLPKDVFGDKTPPPLAVPDNVPQFNVDPAVIFAVNEQIRTKQIAQFIEKDEFGDLLPKDKFEWVGAKDLPVFIGYPYRPEDFPQWNLQPVRWDQDTQCIVCLRGDK